MSGKFRDIIHEIENNIASFHHKNAPALGVQTPARRETLAQQIVDSLRRTDFVRTISHMPVSAQRCDPGNGLFDPLKASIHYRNNGLFDEAHWIAFLGTHFGKHESQGWKLAAKVYGGLQDQPFWTWARASQDPDGITNWLYANRGYFLDQKNNLKFSNHRKYEALNTQSRYHTGEVAASYIRWVLNYGDHRTLINNIQANVGQNPHEVFDGIYSEMTKNVLRFGRLGAFDHVCMIGKLDLAPVEPGSAYIGPATGPRRGANLLLLDDVNAKTPARDLDSALADFGQHMGIGMQEVEDSLCNWQKSPDVYKFFKG